MHATSTTSAATTIIANATTTTTTKAKGIMVTFSGNFDRDVKFNQNTL